MLELAQGPAGIEALRRKYSQYTDEPPPGPLLRLTVERARSWRAADYRE